MIDAIIAVFAIIILASAAIVGAVMVALIVFGLRCIFGPCFDEYGEIHECPAAKAQKKTLVPAAGITRHTGIMRNISGRVAGDCESSGRRRKGVNTGTCKSCGKQILWIRTRTGRSMPCDTKPVNYRIKHGGDTKLVTPAGDVISCEAVKDPAEAQGWGYVPHWSTCDAPDKFKRRTRP